MENPIGFGIVGCGVIADFHANALADLPGDARLIGAADVRPQAAAAFAERHNVRAFASVEELLACPDVDVVNICTPSGFHAETAVAAANAGKHIIVEKPMAITSEQLDRMQEACEKIVGVGKVQKPVKENVSAYEKYFRLYDEIYPAVKNIYSKLADL